MFYSQPLATRFGTSLIGRVDSGGWKKIGHRHSLGSRRGSTSSGAGASRIVQLGLHSNVADLDWQIAGFFGSLRWFAVLTVELQE